MLSLFQAPLPTEHIGTCQKRTMKIIFDNNWTDYENFCLFHKLDTFEVRQTELCKCVK